MDIEQELKEIENMFTKQGYIICRSFERPVAENIARKCKWSLYQYKNQFYAFRDFKTLPENIRDQIHNFGEKINC